MKMPHRHFYSENTVYLLLIGFAFTVISFSIISSHISFSYAGDFVQDIQIRGIATGNMDIPKVIIEDTSSGSLQSYRLHDIVNGYEIVDIQQKGILLKKGDEEVRVLLSNRISLGHKNEQYPEIEEPQIFTFQRHQIDIDNLSEDINTEPGPDVGKRDASLATGITVSDIKEGNFLNKMGIKTGDILLDFNDTQINQSKDLEIALEKLINTEVVNPGEGLIIRIAFERDGVYQTRYGELR